MRPQNRGVPINSIGTASITIVTVKKSTYIRATMNAKIKAIKPKEEIPANNLIDEFRKRIRWVFEDACYPTND